MDDGKLKKAVDDLKKLGIKSGGWAVPDKQEKKTLKEWPGAYPDANGWWQFDSNDPDDGVECVEVIFGNKTSEYWNRRKDDWSSVHDTDADQWGPQIKMVENKE